MKLNKVLALALSGVMAVSMLAGCSNNSGNGGQNGEEQPPVDDTTIASVLNDEQADNDVKVNFTYSSSLETALQKTLSVVGNDAAADSVDDYLANVLGVDDVIIKHFYGYPNQTSGTLNTVGEQTAVVVIRDKAGKTEDGVAKEMYTKLANGGLDKLTAEWLDTNANKQVKWSFSYTGEVAAVSTVEDNQNYTYVAVVVTCNTTKALAD